MRIIEKKCPNCGAKLEFNVGDKETKCKYCNSGFIIEDNNTSEKKFSLDNINLKYIKNFTIIHMIITGVIMLLIVSTFLSCRSYTGYCLKSDNLGGKGLV